MPTKLDTDFLERAERSGLVAAEKLSQLLDELGSRGVDVDNPQAVADALVDNETLTRWQADNLLQGKHKGFFLGSYRLLRPVGRGGMGTVYLAQHEMMRRLCAVKVLPETQRHEGSSILERFYVEAQAVAAMDHPNIVRAYDVNKETKDNKVVHYLVMEFIDGQDIQAMVQGSGPLDCIKAADYVRQTANGLAHAHESRLVHRDIKPANLLVDKKGVVKILDLGLARLHDDNAQAGLTAAHNETVLGTADYLSPEQALNSHDVDHRTDLYSLGCTAYFMLTGHPPFPEGSIAQRLVAHQVKTPTPLIEERPDAPRDLVAIVEKMMAKNPDKRYQSGAEVSTVLAGWLLEHGGEDWRRQHSEIAGDSGLLSLLRQREPTRAMSSPTSETELELAPMDAGADLSSTSGSRIALSPPTSGGRPSDSKTRKTAESSEVGLADLEEDAPSKSGSGVKQAVPTPPARAKQPPAKSTARPKLEPLPELQSSDLGSLESHDPLGSLDSADLLGVSDQAAASAPAADAWLQATTPGPVLTSFARRSAPEPPKGLLASMTSVGLPILVGSAGGVVLVALVIVVLWLRGTSPQVASNPSSSPQQVLPQPKPEPVSSAKPGQGSTDKPPTLPPAIDTPPQSVPKPVEPKPANPPSPESGKQTPTGLTEKSAVRVASGPSQKTADQPKPVLGVPEPTPSEKGPKSPPAPEQKPAAADNPPAKPPLEAAAKPEAAVGGAAKPNQPPSASAGKPSADAIVVLPPELSRKLLANIKEISPELKWDQKTVPPPIAQAVQRVMEDALNLPALGLKVDSNAPAKMRANLTASRENEFFVFRLSAELQCPDSDGKTVTVWSHEQEVGKFTQRAFHSAQTMVRGKVTEFMQRFQRDYRKAGTATRG